MRNALFAACAFACAFAISAVMAQEVDAKAVFQKNCAECHGADRLGGIGPALLPENLGRLKKEEAVDVIAYGRPATQMLGFRGKLKAEEILALTAYVYSPLPNVPDWGMDKIRQTQKLAVSQEELPAKPSYSADPLNLFTVVEAGDHHITILDGDRLEPLARLETHFAVHGGAKYSPDGRFVYLLSRDGWVSKYDLYSLKLVADVRAGINSRNVAVSADGKYVAVGNTLPHSLVILNAADLSPVKIIPIDDGMGRSSRVSAVYVAPPRNSFIVALKDIKELWEVYYTADHKPVYPGYVHSYESGMVEALGADKGAFAVRRIQVDDYLDDFFFDPSYKNVIGTARNARNGQVVNLVVGRKIADIPLSGMPHLASGIVFPYQGRDVLATPDLKNAEVSVVDMTDWKLIKRIPTLGPGFFLRGHESTPYAWADVYFGPNKDAMHIIDTRTLEIVKTLRPEPGKLSSHVEFDRLGKVALVSLMEQDGALVAYDAKTFAEIKRIPMKKPIGKYNVYNKITFSVGTSH